MHARFALTLFFGVMSAAAWAETRWQRVSADGHKVGHAVITREAGADGVVETERREVQLGRPSRRVKYRIALDTESGPAGELRRMSREVTAPEGRSLVVARVVGSDLEIVEGVGRTETKRTLAGAAVGLKTHEFARRWLAEAAAGGAPRPLTYRTWDPVTASVVDVELRASSAGETNFERRVRSAGGNATSRKRADARGDVVREVIDLGAYELEIEDVTEAEALAANDVFDHIAPLLQKSPYRIPARDMRAKIRYGFDNHGYAVAPPAGAGQRTWTEGQTTWIQVCAECALDPAELSASERAAALQATQWLQSDDPKLAQRARSLTRSATDDAARMRRLTAFVRDHMSTQIDMLGYGSALEALQTRRGDCTEFAVLLAALGRAAGVPTRIAVGSAYARHFEGARHVFVPHAWVQAWTGTGWQSFDAAIGYFDSTHLAFFASYDGSPVSHHAGVRLSRALTMKSAARVVPRKPAN